MSETYTIGGDALYLLEANHIAGQTFTPLESHALYYLDLNLKSSFITAPPKVQVYLTDASHEPTGSPLVNITIHPPNPPIPSVDRVRVEIPTPFMLYAGTEYALLCLYELPIIGTRASWQYDSALATYPRGHRIHSEDGGATWTHELGSDHIFCEFGNPPLPQQKPKPPILPFAGIDIRFTPTWFGLLIVLTTATPCHLTCYYTEKKPLKHPTERIIRGINVLWGSYFCFVAWHALEQIEPGDTLYHTFNFEEWPVCLTRWFTFRGEVDTLQSPSVGPIFKYHRVEYELPEVLKNLSFEDWPNPALPPAHWTKFTVGGGFGSLARETTIIHQGIYAPKITTGGFDYGLGLRQIADPTLWRGLNLSFKSWGYGIPDPMNRLTVGVNGTGAWLRHDSLTIVNTWQQLEVSGIIPDDATLIRMDVLGWSPGIGPAYTYHDDITIGKA